jgi:hypothetical protein
MRHRVGAVDRARPAADLERPSVQTARWAGTWPQELPRPFMAGTVAAAGSPTTAAVSVERADSAVPCHAAS